MSSWQVCWSLIFGRFSFSLTYCPGSKNIKPGALSYQLSFEEAPASPDTILSTSCVVGALTWEIESMIHETQREEPDPGDGPPNNLFIPQSASSQVLQWSHASQFSCHPDISRTLSLLKRHFWWPSMEADTWSYVQACTVCSYNKTSH